MKSMIDFFVIRKNNEVIDIIGLNDRETYIQLNISLNYFSKKGLEELEKNQWFFNSINENNNINIEHEAIRLTFEFDDLKGTIEQKEVEII